MACVTELTKLFGGATSGDTRLFKEERFVAIGSIRPPHPMPQAEMLFHVDGINNEEFFALEGKSPEEIRKTNLAVFEKAIEDHLRQGQAVSINIHPTAFFSMEFFELLVKLRLSNENLDPKNLWIEITEHGGVPANFDPVYLRIADRLGFKLALDDVDVRNDDDLERLNLFLPHVHAIKFPYTVLQELRHDNVDLALKIRALTQKNPNKTFVMEGVQEREMTDEPLKKLTTIGIHYAQISSYQERDTNFAPLAPSP